jgi:hypothetical protein
MYKVVKDFTDLQDNNYVYHAGDEYPRVGAKPDAKRIDELGSKFNKRGEVLIEAVSEALSEPETKEKPSKAGTDEKPKKSPKKGNNKEK